ncbi:MAG: cytochrome P450 [Dehalococcoidia bacterium]
MTATDSVYDPTGEAVLADPFPAYAAMREGCPMHRTEQFGHPVYTVSRATDVHAILTAPGAWSNELGPGVGYSYGASGDVQRFDDPEHLYRRQFLRKDFTPAKVKEAAGATRTLAEATVEALKPRGQAELHDDFAMPLPIVIFIDMLGVPRDDKFRIKHWADEMVLGLADPSRSGAAGGEIVAYVRALAAERRAAADAAGLTAEQAIGTVVPAGLLSQYALLPFKDGQRMDISELCGMVLQLMVAGHETTTSLITNAVWRLLSDRPLWDALVADPALAEVAVDESLRYDPPVLGLCRTNNEPTELLGEELPKDTKVMVLYASANRDASVFHDPDAFRLDREPLEASRHYSFGWGTHHCLGAHLARQTARIALETLATRLPSLRLAGETERIAPAFLWGRRRLPVAWDVPAG